MCVRVCMYPCMEREPFSNIHREQHQEMNECVSFLLVTMGRERVREVS